MLVPTKRIPRCSELRMVQQYLNIADIQRCHQCRVVTGERCAKLSVLVSLRLCANFLSVYCLHDSKRQMEHSRGHYRSPENDFVCSRKVCMYLLMGSKRHTNAEVGAQFSKGKIDLYTIHDRAWRHFSSTYRHWVQHFMKCVDTSYTNHAFMSRAGAWMNAKSRIFCLGLWLWLRLCM